VQEAQQQLAAVVGQAHQQLAPRAGLDAVSRHHALDLRRLAVAHAADGAQPRFVLVAQRQVQRQVDVAQQPELAHGLRRRRELFRRAAGGLSLRSAGAWSAMEQFCRVCLPSSGRSRLNTMPTAPCRAPSLHRRRFRFRPAARADRPAPGARAQRLAAARRHAAPCRWTGLSRPARAAAARRPAGVQRHPRHQGPPASAKSPPAARRGAGRARVARPRGAGAPARQQVAAAGQLACASAMPSTPRCWAARARRARCSPALSGRPAGAAGAPRPCAAAALHHPRRRRPRTPSATRPCSPAGPARWRRRPRRCTSTRRCWPRCASAASATARVTLHVGAGTFQPVRVEQPGRAPHAQRVVRGRRETVAGHRRTRRAAGASSPWARPALRALESARSGRRHAAACPGRHRHLHHAGLRVPGRRPAADQLPPAAQHADDAGQRLRRPRPRDGAVPPRHRARYRFFSYGDAMLLQRQ
jgi:hypothetical protein